MSGKISYAKEFVEIARTMEEYRSDMKKWINMRERYFGSLKGSGDPDSDARRWLCNHEFIDIDNCQAKLQELLDIKWESMTKELLDQCKQFQKVHREASHLDWQFKSTFSKYN